MRKPPLVLIKPDRSIPQPLRQPAEHPTYTPKEKASPLTLAQRWLGDRLEDRGEMGYYLDGQHDIEHGSIEAHERLVKACLEELALMGFAAWENPRRAVKVNGRWVSLTKSGRGDIQVILPRVFGVTLVGIHGEIECKTGQSGQSTKQRAHMRMVRNSGGVYLVVRAREEVRPALAQLGVSPRGSASEGGR